MLIYPNPVNNGILNINLDGVELNKNITVSIFDIMGKNVFSNNAVNNNSILNLNLDLSSGIYTLMVTSENVKLIEKLIIK